MEFHNKKEICRKIKNNLQHPPNTKHCTLIKNHKAKKKFKIFFYQICYLKSVKWWFLSELNHSGRHSVLVLLFVVCVRKGHQSKLRMKHAACCLWNSSSTAVLLILKLAVWVVRVTDQTCTEEIGGQTKWRQNENIEARGGSVNMMCCILLPRCHFHHFPWVSEAATLRCVKLHKPDPTIPGMDLNYIFHYTLAHIFQMSHLSFNACFLLKISVPKPKFEIAQMTSLGAFSQEL